MADASYSFDIDANMQGGETAIEQLNALADRLNASSTVATQFDSAIAQVQAALEQSGAAAQSAADAVSAGEAKYRQLEIAANKAAMAVEKALASGKDTGNLQAAADAAKAALTAEGAALDELRAKAAAAQGEHDKLSGTMKTLEGAAKKAAGKKEGAQSIEQLTYAAKGALGPMGGLFERVTMLAKGFGSGGPWGMIIAASLAVVALTGAIIGLTFELAKMALTASDAAIKNQLMLKGLTGSDAAAATLGDSIKRVAAQSPQATAEIQKLAEKLYQSGLRGKALEDALLKASLAASGLGKAAPEDVRKRMANLDVQAIKFKEHIADIFSGPSTVAAVGKFEEALLQINELFSQNTSTGQALRALVSGIVDPLFEGVTAVAPVAKELFRGMVVGALDVAIVVLRLRNALAKVIDMPGMDLDWLTIGKVAAYAIVLALVALGAAFVALVGIAVVVGAALASLGAILVGIPAAVMGLAGVIAAAVVAGIAYLVSLADAGYQAASDLISGLVGGITSGAGAVYSALQNLAAGMTSTIKSALGISSPSKVFAQLGDFTAQGFAQGVDSGSGKVDQAVTSMVSKPEAAPSGGKSSQAGGVVIENNTFIFQGVEGGSDIEARLLALMDDWAQRLLMQTRGATT